MRSFAVIAGLAATAIAAPQYGYEEASSSAPAYEVASSSAAGYTPAHPAASSSAAGYTPAYPVASSSAAEYSPAYPVASSSAAEYSPAYPVESAPPAYTTTEVISATSYVCPEPTTITYGPSTYVVSSSTVLDIPEYTATYIHTPTAHVPEASTTAPGYPVVPEASHPAVPYPSSNGTVPVVPSGTYPAGTGAVPSATKPATPEFTGAAGKVTVGFFAIAGAVAAFL